MQLVFLGEHMVCSTAVRHEVLPCGVEYRAGITGEGLTTVTLMMTQVTLEPKPSPTLPANVRLDSVTPQKVLQGRDKFLVYMLLSNTVQIKI